MRELCVAKLPEYVEEDVRVSEWSTVRVKHCADSVPSRLIGEWVRVRIFEDKIEVRYADELQLACERLLGRNRHRVDYRHVIWSLVRKPGAFARYVYREEMFPQLVFRKAYDAIQAVQLGTKGDLEYLRILHLAASTMEADVAAALSALQPLELDFGNQLAGTAFQIRFRLGTNGGGAFVGWFIDDITVHGLINTPFPTLVAETATCTARKAAPGTSAVEATSGSPAVSLDAFDRAVCVLNEALP